MSFSVPRYARRCCIVLSVATCCNLHAEIIVEKTSTQGAFHFLEEPLSARAMGMGTAATAVGTSGFSYYNPAIPYLIGKPTLTADYGQQTGADLGRSLFEGIWVNPSWFAGLAFSTFTVDKIFKADETGIGTAFNWQESYLAATVGMSRSNYGLAVTAHGLQMRAETQTGYGISLSAGGAFRLLDNKLTLGIAAFHLGTTTPMIDSAQKLGQGDDLPLSGRVGVAWSDSLKGIPYTVAVDAVYRYEDGKMMLPIGLEVYPIQFLAIRVGSRLGHDTDRFSFGFGLRSGALSADAGFAIPMHNSESSLKWVIGLSYALVTPPQSRTREPTPHTFDQPPPVPVPSQNLPSPSSASADSIETQVPTPEETLPPDPVEAHAIEATPETAGEPLIPEQPQTPDTEVPHHEGE